MDKEDKKLAEIRKNLEEIESKIQTVRNLLFEQVYHEQAQDLNDTTPGTSTIVEGVFDGENMIDGMARKYPVAPNYASKSKLVAGDKLKLTIADDGTFIFKQIGPVDRKKIIGTLSEKKGSWQVSADGKKYNVLQASVTYFKAKNGEKVTVIIPKSGESNWAAIENCIEEDIENNAKK